MFNLNTYRGVARSHEVTRTLASRVIGELPIGLYRTQRAQAVALANKCAHRGYPLFAGRLIGDGIECGGFIYGPDGISTTASPHANVPSKACVADYPVVEKDDWVWIWPDREQDVLVAQHAGGATTRRIMREVRPEARSIDTDAAATTPNAKSPIAVHSVDR